MGKADGSFDLFSARKGRKVEAVLVVTPYVEREFFDRLLSQLRPKRLNVVIDDGCRFEDETMIAESAAAAPRRLKLSCAFGSAPGLVHLKLFYVVWRTEGGRTERSLVFGSANATRQGFSGLLNAELIANCRLTKTNHSGVIAWCERVMAATTAGERTPVEAQHDLTLDGVSLRLPAMVVGPRKGASSSFDLWVQRGYLLATYRAEPGFLKVSIPLKRELEQTEQAKFVAAVGFEKPPSKRLTYAYVGRDGFLPEEEEFADDGRQCGNWRGRYFVWTQFGFWCSEECHLKHLALFRRRGHDARERQLEALGRLATPSVLEEGRQGFVAMLERLWTGFGDEASKFLEGSGSLNAAHYRRIYDKRVARDLELVTGREFKERYLTGFEIAQVPRFRTDLRGWREFLESIARQICLDDVKARPQSLLLHAVREAISKVDPRSSALEGAGELIKFLQGIWDVRSSRPGKLGKAARIIANYHLR
ncbi:hypothetical protein NZL82_19505 [Sphingomonas sanguinis]|uniref:hypothetical protein n=1 Tax=Sphingomonas sp. LC-1 TaxID=3110957 RepID=UPI0021BB86BA|nr:hypothetical protein [Sphingomonas sp. LC-1]MCT8004049.1 hypothetical protein [Sphingomonas sp. LC-1]